MILDIPDGMAPEQIVSSYGLSFTEPVWNLDVPDYTDEETGEIVDMSWAFTVYLEVRDIPTPGADYPDIWTSQIIGHKSLLPHMKADYLRLLKEAAARYILNRLEKEGTQ